MKKRGMLVALLTLLICLQTVCASAAVPGGMLQPKRTVPSIDPATNGGWNKPYQTCGFILNDMYYYGMNKEYHALAEYNRDKAATCVSGEEGHYVARHITIKQILYFSTESVVVSEPDPDAHQWVETVYEWNGDRCTAISDVCSLNHTHKKDTSVSETVTGVYVMDTQASSVSPETGHYEAVFTQPKEATQTTEKDSVKVQYEWSGDQCTGFLVYAKDPSVRSKVETVTGVYVKDSDATCTDPERGHYEATFTTSWYAPQKSEAVYVGKKNPSHHVPERTYTWEGRYCTALCGCGVKTTLQGLEKVDTQAACTTPELGHYEALFYIDAEYVTVSTEPNSLVLGPALGHNPMPNGICRRCLNRVEGNEPRKIDLTCLNVGKNGTLELRVGDERLFSVADGLTIPDGQAWKSTKGKVLSITSEGAVKALATGRSTVKIKVLAPNAKGKLKKKTASIIVNVIDPSSIRNIRIVPIEPIRVGSEMQLKLWPEAPEDCAVTFKSAKPKVVSVDETTGTLAALKPGKAKITVTIKQGGIKKTASITVEVKAAEAKQVAE